MTVYGIHIIHKACANCGQAFLVVKSCLCLRFGDHGLSSDQPSATKMKGQNMLH